MMMLGKIVILMLITGQALAMEPPPPKKIIFEWPEVTKRLNGEPLKDGELKQYIIEIDCGGEPIEVYISAPKTNYVYDTAGKKGACEFAVRAEDSEGLISGRSKSVSVDLGKGWAW